MKSNDERDAIDEARQRWESGPVADSLRRLPERDNLRTWSEVPVARRGARVIDRRPRQGA